MIMPGSEKKLLRYTKTVLLGLAGLLVVLGVSAFVASFFLDGFIRPRFEASMNQDLKGYHATLTRAHLQLLDGVLTLRGLRIIQEKHPTPPVGNFAVLQFKIQWKELLSRRMVADVLLWRPTIRIDTAQLTAEHADKVPLRKKGWQQALENAYPLKINQFRIREGDVTYVDADDPDRPIHIEHLDFTADNIRNIHFSDTSYPSSIHARAVVFDHGRFEADGHANFLSEPFPGIRVKYRMSDVPLGALEPASHHVNLSISGGRLTSTGLVEYAPAIAKVEVERGVLDGVEIDYLHAAQTSEKEAQTVDAAGKAVKKENNSRQVVIRLKEFDITRSGFAFDDDAKIPNYRLFLTDSEMKITNLSNQGAQGAAHVDLHGKFMGSGDTSLNGAFLSGKQGPDFSMNLAITNTELPTMNDLLRAYGRFEVERGRFTVYSQLGVNDGSIKGYVKPMFSDLQIYSWSKDKDKSVLQQAYRLGLQGAASLFKNSRTQQLAAKVELSGRLENPNASTWQTVVEVLRNAFVEAILPGFDREASLALARDQNRVARSRGYKSRISNGVNRERLTSPGFQSRKTQKKDGASGRAVLRGNLAADPAHHIAGHGKTQAAAGRLGREERGEDLCHHVRGDAAAFI